MVALMMSSSSSSSANLIPAAAGSSPRTGRHNQLYDHDGFRRVAGCIPYRHINKLINGDGHDVDHGLIEKEKEKSCSWKKSIEVLVITAQKSDKLLFPKGGWEKDESVEDAAKRETLEEAGVIGELQDELGRWRLVTGRGLKGRSIVMFSLNVTQVLECWPECDIRERSWVNVEEALSRCKHSWMKDALKRLIQRLDYSTTTTASSCAA